MSSMPCFTVVFWSSIWLNILTLCLIYLTLCDGICSLWELFPPVCLQRQMENQMQLLGNTSVWLFTAIAASQCLRTFLQCRPVFPTSVDLLENAYMDFQRVINFLVTKMLKLFLLFPLLCDPFKAKGHRAQQKYCSVPAGSLLVIHQIFLV